MTNRTMKTKNRILAIPADAAATPPNPKIAAMIKSSGYRISPTEVEEVLYATQAIGECAVFGLPSTALGESVAAVVTARGSEDLDVSALLAACREKLPAFMAPARIDVHPGPLPRNPNGKIDRKSIAAAVRASIEGEAA